MRDFLIRSVLIGGFATAVLDLWAILLNRLFGTPLANWAMVGRWVRHLPRGRVVHSSMDAAQGFANELTVGWIFHYAVGVLFAAAMLVIWPDWARTPTLWPPLIVGWVTILCGWLILAPGMGGGIAHCRRANAGQARRLNLAGHTVFGLAMWIAGLALSGL